MKFWIVAILTPGMMAVADSVWEQAAEKQHSKEVFVKSISSNGETILVTVVSTNKSEDHVRETVELCSQFPGGDIANTAEMMKSNLVQQAFSEGRPLTVQFSGTFNRCISKVKLL